MKHSTRKLSAVGMLICLRRYDNSALRNRNHSNIPQIVLGWFSLQNTTTGWIAREQIIGSESQGEAPSWVRTTRTRIRRCLRKVAEGDLQAWAGITNQMNPPVFFQTVEEHVTRNYPASSRFLSQVYPKMQLTYQWYLSNCQTKVPNTFVWQGRLEDMSLDSGLYVLRPGRRAGPDP